MTKTEQANNRIANIRERGKQLTDGVVAFGGAYAAGRYARNSKIQGIPLPLIVGGLGLFMKRKGKGSAAMRTASMAFIGAGCGGAYQLGANHGQAAGNDGNLFSWGSDSGFTTD